jgi:hypothetical protein
MREKLKLRQREIGEDNEQQSRLNKTSSSSNKMGIWEPRSKSYLNPIRIGLEKKIERKNWAPRAYTLH